MRKKRIFSCNQPVFRHREQTSLWNPSLSGYKSDFSILSDAFVIPIKMFVVLNKTFAIPGKALVILNRAFTIPSDAFVVPSEIFVIPGKVSVIPSKARDLHVR